MAMNINNLKIFINVADSGNITRTASAMHITQPSVSKAIKNLETDLGTQLFYRDKKNGMILTDTGRRVLYYARQIMLMEEKIYQTAYHRNNVLGGTLKIASLPHGVLFFLVKALSRFKEKYPLVNVEITEGSTLRVNRMVENHEAEFGITLIPADDFEHITLMKDRIVAISRETISGGVVDLTKIKSNMLVCQSAWEIIRPVLEENKIKDMTRFNVVGEQTVRSMAREGLGIGLQAESIVSKNKEDYHIYPIDPHIETDFVLITNSFDDLSPAAKAFVDIINEMNKK